MKLTLKLSRVEITHSAAAEPHAGMPRVYLNKCHATSIHGILEGESFTQVCAIGHMKKNVRERKRERDRE